jgi:hypothetical protein
LIPDIGNPPYPPLPKGDSEQRGFLSEKRFVRMKFAAPAIYDQFFLSLFSAVDHRITTAISWRSLRFLVANPDWKQYLLTT